MTTQTDSSDFLPFPSTREEAIAQGRKRYFTGEPCVHGHVSTRWASNNRCYECARVSCVEQYRADPDAGRARTRRYLAENYDAAISRRREHYPAEKEARLFESESREQDADRWRAAFLIQEVNGATIREIIDYRPETGEFFWRISWGKVKPGDVAATRTKHYATIAINRTTYYAHRIAYLYMSGEWPEALVDHKDRDHFNNRWSNLRPANYSQNVSNQGLSQRNKSGLKGAYWSGERGVWYSTVKVGGKTKCIGTFSNKEDAHSAFMKWKRKLVGEFACAG